MKKTVLIASMILAGSANAANTLTTSKNQTQSVNTGYQLAGGDAIALTQNNDIVNIETGTIACSDQKTGLTADNSYYRHFDLDGLGMVNVSDVDMGIQTATSGSGAGQPYQIVLHSLPNGVSLALSNLTQVSILDVNQPDVDGAMVNHVIDAAINGDNDDLVMEIRMPDGQPDGNALFVGSNAGGQTGPSYLSSVTCGLTEIADLASIGDFGDVHILMVVNGTASMPVELMNFSID